MTNVEKFRFLDILEDVRRSLGGEHGNDDSVDLVINQLSTEEMANLAITWCDEDPNAFQTMSFVLDNL